jgi:predicted phage tail protein
VIMEERFVTVKLLGELGRKFGREYRFLVRNPRDVISALSRQVDGFKEYLCMAHENNVGFKLVTKEPEGIDYEHVTMSCDRLVIAPMIAGSGGATGKILLGVALVGLSFVSFGAGTVAAGMGAAFAGGSAGIVSTAMFGIGLSMIATGIGAMLTPQVKTPSSDSSKKESFMFDRAAELTTQGFPVPLIYGEYLAGAPLVISSSIGILPS